MRHVLLAAVLVLTALTSTGAVAQERQYPWCARYGWTTSNCGFNTYAQCLATISGVGGYCERNPAYAYAAQPRSKKRYRPY